MIDIIVKITNTGTELSVSELFSSANLKNTDRPKIIKNRKACSDLDNQYTPSQT